MAKIATSEAGGVLAKSATLAAQKGNDLPWWVCCFASYSYSTTTLSREHATSSIYSIVVLSPVQYMARRRIIVNHSLHKPQASILRGCQTMVLITTSLCKQFKKQWAR
jgi:hypothetical protein